MAVVAAYAAPLRASIMPAGLKRTLAARSAYAAAAPDDTPVTASRAAPLGVASNWTVKDPVWALKAVFHHATELVWHDPGGGGVTTVMAAVPLWPSLVAVIVAEPAAAPVTRPLVLTVATDVLLLDQDTARPVSGVPFASCGVAVSCTVPPATTLPVAGLTVTVATGTGGTVVTVIAAVPLCPSLVAVIVAAPAARAVTSPRS